MSPAIRKPPSRLVRRLKFALITLPVLVLALRATYLADSLMFVPHRVLPIARAGVQDVYFTTSDGVKLHGWFLPPLAADGKPLTSPAPAILQVHGNGGNVEGAVTQSDFLPRRGIGVFAFDFRSYGRSAHTLLPLNRNQIMLDTQAAWDCLKSLPQVDRARIGVMAHSIGNTCALNLATTHAECRAVVSISPFTTWKEVATVHVRVLPWILLRSGLDPIEEVTHLATRPLLILHGDADRVIPQDHGRRVEAAAHAAGASSEFISVRGIGHNDIIINDAALQNRIADFLAHSLAPPVAAGTSPTKSVR